MVYYVLGLLPALGLLALNDPRLALIAFIVFGQAHFLLAYLYQYRAGKINRWYVGLFLPAIIAVMAVATYAPFIVILLLTAVTFAIHYTYDEARIFTGENHHLALGLLLPPVLFFVAYLVLANYGVDLFWYATAATALLVALHWYRFGSTAFRQPYILITILFSLLLLTLYFLGAPLAAELILGAIIIHHITTWYIFQFQKLSSSTERLSRYLAEVFTLNVVLVLGYLLFTSFASLKPLELFFAPNYYYAWALLHILFSSQELYRAIALRLPIKHATT